jgi:hypothetical protein
MYLPQGGQQNFIAAKQRSAIFSQRAKPMPMPTAIHANLVNILRTRLLQRTIQGDMTTAINTEYTRVSLGKLSRNSNTEYVCDLR